MDIVPCCRNRGKRPELGLDEESWSASLPLAGGSSTQLRDSRSCRSNTPPQSSLNVEKECKTYSSCSFEIYDSFQQISKLLHHPSPHPSPVSIEATLTWLGNFLKITVTSIVRFVIEFGHPVCDVIPRVVFRQKHENGPRRVEEGDVQLQVGSDR